MRIVIIGDWEELADRLEGALGVMREIARIAGRRGNWPARSGTRIFSGFLVFQGVARQKAFLRSPRGCASAVDAVADRVSSAWLTIGK